MTFLLTPGQRHGAPRLAPPLGQGTEQRLRKHAIVFGRRIAGLWPVVVLLSLVLPVCAYSGPAVLSRPGLGVKSAAIQADLSRPAFGFRFEAPQARSGVASVTGTVPGKLILLSLTGPPEDLREVTLIVGVPITNPLARPAPPTALAENIEYLRAVLQQAMPDWKDGVRWLNTQLQRPSERLEVRLRRGHRDITLSGVNHLSMVLLSIRAGHPSTIRGP
jgi:hypothetical protein